jgi:competence protein ComEC
MPMAALVVMSLGGLWLVIWRQRWRWWGLLLVVIGIGVAWTARVPDMLVASDARTVAIRGSDGLLHFVRKAGDKYAARDWLRREGAGRDIDAAVGVPGMRCDGLGCVLKGKPLVAVSIKPEALAEDCAQAQIVISAAQAADCKGPAIVIDQKAAEEGEGWRITLSPTPTAQSVRAYRGARPWVISSRE